ncbi:hypothetical protein JR316_0005297 [Psilocybe cubensis]|uniref:Uncharacterized protein n=2 Tax=Psilocybe cubensis TaxID=181762 RepID=A0ACB8H5Y3_PSICU|nr:hypothetical protein JR316_0005297 [Psilocybe cubensis]KAH9483193.1 hypothetical protein JR316_0005297 [Psilocybe cubensis]
MSPKFSQVFSSLPSEAQNSLVENHLARLLDFLPEDRSSEVLLAATRLQRKYQEAPILDLRMKKRQINGLLDQLIRDAKISFIKERSNREELLSEIIHTLTGWLSDIWTVVYEHNVNFDIAHQCLVFVAEALAQLSESSSLGGCKCTVMNLPVDVSFRSRKGKVVKRFSLMGPQNIDAVLLWIWRDLFVSLLANGNESDKKKLPDFLEDVESTLGIGALERVLYGGRTTEIDGDDDDDDYEDVEDNESEDDIFEEHAYFDEDDSDYDSDASDRCPCNLHAPYWPEKINKERLPLRDYVETRLFEIFKVTPSMRIYNTLLSISQDSTSIEMRATRVLRDIAGDSPDNLVAALDINIANNKQSMIAFLLNSYGYLLRPRDTMTLQCAVAMLDNSPYHNQCITILETQLNESLKAICAAVRSSFPHIEEEDNKNEIVEILKLRSSSSARQERVERWGGRISSSSSGSFHPMAFAAMVMGLPVIPGTEEGDDSDILNYVDLDQLDPDLDDLRDEYRPDLKGTFDGWVHIAQSIKGGPAILAKLYTKALEMLPWVRGSDIVTEMINRLRDRPNKNHVLDALATLNSFSKTQRKKLSVARAEQQKRTAASKAQTSLATSTTQANEASSSTRSTTTSPTLSSRATALVSSTVSPPGMAPMFTPSSETQFSFPPVSSVNGPPLPFPFPQSFSPAVGGMEDVD